MAHNTAYSEPSKCTSHQRGGALRNLAVPGKLRIIQLQELLNGLVAQGLKGSFQLAVYSVDLLGKLMTVPLDVGLCGVLVSQPASLECRETQCNKIRKRIMQ